MFSLNALVKFYSILFYSIVGRELKDYNLRDALSQNLNSTTEFYYSKQIKFTDLDLPYILLGDEKMKNLIFGKLQLHI